MSRAISDESRKILLAGIFLGAAERIGRKPVSEMEPEAESSERGGEEGREESRGDTVQKKEKKRAVPQQGRAEKSCLQEFFWEQLKG